MTGSTILAGVIPLVLAMLAVALVLALFRVVRGPTLPDRFVAVDLIGVISVGFLAVSAIEMEQPVLLDAAIVVALIAFLGTVASARYLEWTVSRD